MRIEGVGAVVTGGGSGLGLAVVRQLAQDGARVGAIDTATTPALDALCEEHPGVRSAVADFTDEESFNGALDLVERDTPIHVLVHCGGRGGDKARLIDKTGRPAPLDTFAEVIGINLVGTYNVLRLVAARMATNTERDGDRGVCVFTLSIAAFEGQIGQLAYAASKAGVNGMVLVAARDLASRQIRVNAIAHGPVEAPLFGTVRGDVQSGLMSSIPHPKRPGSPDEFAQLVRQLITNPYINGATIRFDGALRMAPR